jgi:uncharacterized protein YacL
MEFSIEYYPWLKTLSNNPPYIVIWAAFGVPVLMLLFLLPSKMLRSTKIALLQRLDTAFFASITVTWIIGFVVMMLLLFADIAVIRMAIIWCLIFVFHFVFCFIYYQPIKKWMDKVGGIAQVSSESEAQTESVQKPKAKRKKRSG